MPRTETLRFNKEHNRNYTDEELARRLETAEPFLLFQFLGGAGAAIPLRSGFEQQWQAVRNRARSETGSDDPTVLDDWVEQQRRLVLGIDPLSTVSIERTGTLPGPSFLVPEEREDNPADLAGSTFLTGGSEGGSTGP